jgi:vitamin B12 transporter
MGSGVAGAHQVHRGKWRITYFDNKIEDLITYVFPTVENVKRAHIKGVEASIDAAWLGVRWRASATSQKPRDEDTGKRLQGRSEYLGSLTGENDLRSVDGRRRA